MKSILRKIFGSILLPIFVVIYLYDRAICVLIPIVNHFDIRIWLKNEEEIQNSLIRTIVISIIAGVTYGCYQFIKYVLWS
jgi:hypothetical protein